MRKIISLIAFSAISIIGFATQYTVSFNGFAYAPANISANVGDTINLPASGTHPLRQVSEATWNANQSTQLNGGFNTSSNIQIVISTAENIYYVCSNHVGSGMKGKIEVSAVNSTSNAKLKNITNPIIYPNPCTKGTVKLSVNENTTLVVTDAIGNVVHSSVVKSGTWDCDLSEGMYFYYTLYNNRRSKTQKLIVN